MDEKSFLPIIVAVFSMIGTIIGIIVNFSKIAADREQRGREMGTITSDINHNKDALRRAFEEIDKVKTQINPMMEAIIAIKVGIEHISETMKDFKSCLDEMRLK